MLKEEKKVGRVYCPKTDTWAYPDGSGIVTESSRQGRKLLRSRIEQEEELREGRYCPAQMAMLKFCYLCYNSLTPPHETK